MKNRPAGFPVLPLLIFTMLSWSMLYTYSQQIPLPEHPRPDFQRKAWVNLNGAWDFRFDSLDVGLDEKWFRDPQFDETILVPFPWGSPLSGVENLSDIAWYGRLLEVPESWEHERIFLVIGACDWKTTIWLDGKLVGKHQGGYTPFEFDLTGYLVPGRKHQLVFRVDDSPHPYKLEGKQGYGEAKGIWQTPYLEGRGGIAFTSIHFTPDIDSSKVTVTVALDRAADEALFVNLSFPHHEIPGIITSPRIPRSTKQFSFDVTIPGQKRWELNDPYLYDVHIQLHNNTTIFDEVASYFAMRKISVMKHPGTGYPYVALNNKPLYLKLCLDQAYHPEGFYTYPSDAFMRDEIIRSRKIGLNGNRIHIKAEVPRKLYWADKLGLLIMADVPNFWGEPDDTARHEWEYTMRRMIERDYNHPSIFAWVLFNETWGLFSHEGKERLYRPATQEWVKTMFSEARKLDRSRLIEDNSPCNYDHVVTDLNSWHAYLPGYAWKKFLDNVEEKTYVGSTWNFTGGNRQTAAPMFNSECGNVWGYEGSTGDVDWSWDYHVMMNEFRKHPKVSGWLYTEHHDVINEWNGYYRYDRSEKFPGFSGFIPDMELKHLHSDIYLSTGSELCRVVQPAARVEVPLYLSVMTDRIPAGHYILDYELSGRRQDGRFSHILSDTCRIPSLPYFNGELDPLILDLPATPGLYHLRLRLRDEHAYVYHLNFTSFLVEEAADEAVDDQVNGTVNNGQKTRFTFAPSSFTGAQWTLGQWNILDGLKTNGAGSGFFSYDVPIPSSLNPDSISKVTLVFEASAKKLYGKDRAVLTELGGDYMRGKGTFDPSRNPNAYPMTDTDRYPTILRVRVNGKVVDQFFLPDDPADHRGVLSWSSQKRDRKLREAGSYGYLCKSDIPVRLLQDNRNGVVNIRFEVDEALPGGVAIYGKRFGRYPLDPTLLFK